MKKTLFIRALVLALVSVMMLFAVGCDMSSMFADLEMFENMTGEGMDKISGLIESGAYTDKEGAPGKDKDKHSGNDKEIDIDKLQFAFPVDGTVSKWHSPTAQVYNKSTADYRVHLGIDIVAKEYTPVYAVADGTVSGVWVDDALGQCVSIAHSSRVETVYKNLSTNVPHGISEGEPVVAGQRIGMVGQSAIMEVAEEPHLHFEILIDGKSVDPLEYLNEIEQEDDKNDKDKDAKAPEFISPVAAIGICRKHDPNLQVYNPTTNDYRVHIGVDIFTEESAPVYAVADGTVSKMWVDPLMGYCIAISHSNGYVSIYKNLAEASPSGIDEGVCVRSGQLIGTVGESAMIEIADEPHLHFELTANDLAVDPLQYIDFEIQE